MAGMSSLAGAEAAAGLPSMASVAGTMPGAMGSAYNALPIAERMGALTKEGMGGLFKMPSAKTGLNMGKGLLQMGMGGQQQPPPMASPPPPRQAMPPQPIQPFMTGGPRRDPRMQGRIIYGQG